MYVRLRMRVHAYIKAALFRDHISTSKYACINGLLKSKIFYYTNMISYTSHVTQSRRANRSYRPIIKQRMQHFRLSVEEWTTARWRRGLRVCAGARQEKRERPTERRKARAGQWRRRVAKRRTAATLSCCVGHEIHDARVKTELPTSSRLRSV